MSTTYNCDVALSYALTPGDDDKPKQPMVYRIHMGMVDRGADLSWMSQYPHEVHPILSDQSMRCPSLTVLT